MADTKKRSGERIRSRLALLLERSRRQARPGPGPDSDGIQDPARRDRSRDSASQKRRGRGPQKAPTKVQISIRLDPDVLDRLRAEGRGWQSRLNERLREVLSLDVSTPAE